MNLVCLLGVYVAPISLLTLSTWLAAIAPRWVASHLGMLRHVRGCSCVIVLSSVVLAVP